MLLSRTYRFLILFDLGILCHGCTEPFPIVTKDFESVLVVQATLTDENIQHQVVLSRSYDLEGGGPKFESNAHVMIKDDAQNVYDFQESLPGTYVSAQAFSAQPGRTYQLFVDTPDGRSYSSTGEQLPQSVPIDTLYAEKGTNVDNVEGVVFYVDSHGPPSDKSKYFRYTYEETYKIIAVYWYVNKLIIVSESPLLLGEVPREQEERICYKTQLSYNIALASTSGYTENRISRFPVRFMHRDDYMLRNRYSILVKQYTQSVEAHNYFRTLASFSGAENPFSENQPGFIDGNINSEKDKDEKVIGFFEVSSLSTKRTFINFRDIFESGRFPDFPFECEVVSFADIGTVADVIKTNNYIYAGPPDLLVPRPCGDCTFLGDNKRPDFWVD